MSVENGEWIMYGLDESDPDCIHTIDELIVYIDNVGFLPLFRNEIPGFSVEEHTVPDYWWSGDPDRDPWEWRGIIAANGNAAYGKFYNQKAGFVSKKWLPYFANARRDGYDFDALWDDEKASARQKKIMDFFMDDNSEKEYYSNDLKAEAGFGKGGEKGFESIIAALQMETYLVVRAFRQRENKKGAAYGWPVAIYCTPEHIFGRDIVTAAYSEEPTDSAKRIASHICQHFPEATAESIAKIVLHQKIENKVKRKRTEKEVNYPENLLKSLKLYDDKGKQIESLNPDQMAGLEHALSLLDKKEQKIIHLHFEKGLTYAEAGIQLGRKAGSCSGYYQKASKKLHDPLVSPWITEGVKGYINLKNKRVSDLIMRLDGTERGRALMKYKDENISSVFRKNIAKILHSKSIDTIGDLALIVEQDARIIRKFPGIGEVYYQHILIQLKIRGIIFQ